ncbi:MAG: biotin/lipoyl-binding protein [Isosphaeraceae bacterium]|nr:biotin/lipoyl-binding protein [Isosphaeraceae bacterium]
MFIKYVLPLLAAAGLGFAIYTVVQARQGPPPSKPILEPPTRPAIFEHEIAGAGLIEAKRENIPIGSHVPGVVTRVHVKVGDRVRAGDPLFTLDDRALRAELRVREAALAAAEAELHRLEKAPRPEDLPVAEAAVEEAKARLADAEVAMNRAKHLYERNAGPLSDYDTTRFAYYTAKATLAKVKADLDRLRKGTWEEDLQVARAKVEQARAQVQSVQIDLERLTTTALTDGEVLQVNVRPGQYAAIVWKEPLIVLGDVETLHVRVDIDEHDLPLFRPGAPAVATLRGHPYPEDRFPLEFVRVEPYVIPKKSLTGDNSERVDTRVLQVIYRLPDAAHRPIDVYVGQQMDVYLEARPPKYSTATKRAIP